MSLCGDVNTFGGGLSLGTMATTGSLIAAFSPSSGADLSVAHSPQQATVVTLTPTAPTAPTTPTWQPAHEPSMSPNMSPSTAPSTAQTLLTALDSGSQAAGAGLIEVRLAAARASPCGCSRAGGGPLRGGARGAGTERRVRRRHGACPGSRRAERRGVCAALAPLAGVGGAALSCWASLLLAVPACAAAPCAARLLHLSLRLFRANNFCAGPAAPGRAAAGRAARRRRSRSRSPDRPHEARPWALRQLLRPARLGVVTSP